MKYAAIGVLLVIVALLLDRLPRGGRTQCQQLSGFWSLWGYQCDLRAGHGGKHVCEVTKYGDGSRGTISW